MVGVQVDWLVFLKVGGKVLKLVESAAVSTVDRTAVLMVLEKVEQMADY